MKDMEPKTWLQYLLLISKRSSIRAWETIGAWGTCIGVVAAIAVSMLITKPKSLSDLGGNEAVIVGIVLAGIFFLIMLFFIAKEPVIVHNEQQSTIEQLHKERVDLQKQAEPKLIIQYDDSDRASHLRDAGFHVFRISVTNISTTVVNGVRVKLTETIPTPITSLPADLHFMHDDLRMLNPGDVLYVDVIKARRHKNERGGHDEINFYFDSDALSYQIPAENYSLHISASGDNSQLISKWFEFSIEGEISDIPFLFRERN